MNFCPNCGAPLAVGQNFCRQCGFDVRAQVQVGEAQAATPEIRGLARNRVIYLTQEGLVGARIQSEFLLFLAVLLPIPLLAVFWYATQLGSLAIYITVWVVGSSLLFDLLKGRGLQKIKQPDNSTAVKSRWLVPWPSIRMADWNGRTLWFLTLAVPHKVSVTFDKKDAQRVETTLRSWDVMYAWRPPRLPRRLTAFLPLVILVFVASQVVMFAAATLPFFPGEEQVYTTVLNSTRSQVVNATVFDQFRFIYLNNLQVAWGSMVPGLGAIGFLGARYNTGRVIQVLAISDSATLHQTISPALLYLSLFLYPHSWVEELSYPAAVVAGIFGVTRWRSLSPEEFARPLNRGSTKLVFAMGGVALSLMAAAVLEVASPLSGYGAFLLWVPVGVAYYMIVTYRRRRAARSASPVPIP
jgi:hypothetical protein